MPQHDALAVRYVARQGTLSMAGGAVVADAWGRLPQRADNGAVLLRELALPTLTTLLLKATALTAGYMGIVLEEAVAPISQTVEPDWDLPFIDYQAALDRGEEQVAAIQAGASSSSAIGRQSVVSTARQAGDAVQSSRIIAWRRVPDGDACDWCLMVAGDRYKSATSADFGHLRCECGVSPVLSPR